MDIRGVSGLWKVHSPNPIFGLDCTEIFLDWTRTQENSLGLHWIQKRFGLDLDSISRIQKNGLDLDLTKSNPLTPLV